MAFSLTDFHRSNLLDDIIEEAPHLYLAKKLNEDPNSPWFKLIKLGGGITSSPKRKTSLRMMQRAIRKYLDNRRENKNKSIEVEYNLLLNFWISVKETFPDEWRDHRHHLITKGIGVYSLTILASDLVSFFGCTSQKHFMNYLKQVKKQINWKSDGMFSNMGGHKGAIEVYRTLRESIQ